MSGTVDERCRKKEMPDGGADNMRCWEEEVSEDGMGNIKSVSYTHLTLPTNREV